MAKKDEKNYKNYASPMAAPKGYASPTTGNVASKMTAPTVDYYNVKNTGAGDVPASGAGSGASGQAYADQLRAQQDWYVSQLQAQQQAQQRAAENAYNNNKAALESAYQKKLSNLSSNLDSTKNQLANFYNNSQASLNQSAEKALQEAYVNRMMNERSLKNQLGAQGITGGASESAIANMLNEYGNSRNNINTVTANNLRDLEQNYNDNVASALRNYNDAVTSAEDARMAYLMQLENDLKNSVVGSYGDLYSAMGSLDGTYANFMSNLISQQASRDAARQKAADAALAKEASGTSDVDVSKQYSPVETGTTRALLLRNSGMSDTDIALSMQKSGYSNDVIAQVFSDLGWIE